GRGACRKRLVLGPGLRELVARGRGRRGLGGDALLAVPPPSLGRLRRRPAPPDLDVLEEVLQLPPDEPRRRRAVLGRAERAVDGLTVRPDLRVAVAVDGGRAR